MYDLMYLHFGRQRHREMMREAGRERLAAEARKARRQRADRHRTSELGWELRRLGSRLLKGLKPRKNIG